MVQWTQVLFASCQFRFCQIMFPLISTGAVFPMPITSTPNRGISPSLPPVSPASHSDLTSPPSSLDSSFNSTMSLDSAGMETGSLNGLFKSRRARKKSWRQVGYTVSIVTSLLFIFSLCTKLLLFKKQTCWFCLRTFLEIYETSLVLERLL